MRRRLVTVAVALVAITATVSAAKAIIGPGSEDTLLRTRDGLVASGYVDACKVVRVEPGRLAIGDGSLVIPVVYAYLVTRQRVALADIEGGVDTVAQSIRNAQPACHLVTLSEAQLKELADLIEASP